MVVLEKLKERLDSIIKEAEENGTRLTEYKIIGEGFNEIYTNELTEYGKTKKSIMLLQNSNTARMVDKYLLEDFRREERYEIVLYETAMKFLQQDGGMLYIGGQSGSGKTHIGVGITTEFMLERGKEVMYIVWNDFALDVKSDYSTRRDKMRPVQEVEVLYIDDFFKSKNSQGMVSEADIALAHDIINYRYNNDLLTIITSEEYISDIESYSDSVAGRIKEMSGDNIIEISRSRARNKRNF